jgi:hypothetical protein
MLDQILDELLMGLAQLSALPLRWTEYLAVVKRVIGYGKPNVKAV